MSARPESFRHTLSPHPASRPSPVRSIVVGAVRHENSLLLNYRVDGELAAVRMPELLPPVHTDNLWRHTCFEPFVGTTTSAEYCECYLSPSGAWAAYRFSAYRAGMQPLKGGRLPNFAFDVQDGDLVLTAQLDLGWMQSPQACTARIGVTAVIEDRSGEL